MPRKIQFLFVLFLAAALGLGFVFVFRTGNALAIYNLGIDTPTYRFLALQVSKDGLAAIPEYQPPGFLLYLAFFFSFLPHPVLAIKLVNLVLVWLSAACMFYVAGTIRGRIMGYMAAAGIVSSSALLCYSASIQYEVLAAFMVSAVLAILYQARRATDSENPLLSWVLSSLLLSLATLVREASALIFPVLLVAACLQPAGRSRVLLKAALIILVYFTPILAWSGHQFLATGHLVPVSSKGSVNLRIGNNPSASGTFNLLRTPISEPSGAAFIKQFPLQAAGLSLKKAGYLWGFLEDGWNIPRISSVVIWHAALGLLPFGWCIILARCGLSLLALAGMAISLGDAEMRKRTWPLIGLCILTTAFYAVFIGSFRFLVPLLPVLYVFAAMTLVVSAQQIKPYLKAGTMPGVLMLSTVYMVCLIFARPAGELELAAKNLDGESVVNISEPDSAYTEVLYAPAAPGARVITFAPPRYFPAGKVEFKIRLRPDQMLPPETEYARFRARRANSSRACGKIIKTAADTTVYQTASIICRLKRSEPLALEVFSLANTGIRVDAILARLGGVSDFFPDKLSSAWPYHTKAD